MLKHGMLGLINYHDMTGYEILEVFRDSLHFFWNATPSQIYRELKTLEKKNWVSKTMVPQQGKPNKNVYSITEEGKSELLRWISSDFSGLNFHNPILMKVFFMGGQSREESIRYFESLKAYCKIFLENIAPIYQYIEAYSSYLDDKEQSLYWMMTVDYGYRNMQMCMEWAESCMEQLRGSGKEQ